MRKDQEEQGMSRVTAQHGVIELNASSAVTLRRGADRVEVPLEFSGADGTQTAVDGLGPGMLTREKHSRDGVAVVREVFRPAAVPQRLAVRLRLSDRSAGPLSVDALTPLVAAEDGLRLGTTPAGQWVYLRQPRYKNDMPASTVLGSAEPGVWDAVRGTQETGGWGVAGSKAELPRVYISSELTLLKGAEGGVLIGALPLDQQLVTSRLELSSDRQDLASFRVDCLCDGQLLAPGQELTSQWVLVDMGPDPFDAVAAYVDSLAAAAGGTRRGRSSVPQRPTVWCSWYYYGNAFTQAEAEANLAALEQRPLPFDVFQIDECWDLDFGDWEPNSDWPDLAGLARRCAGAGYIPGIWTCGFLLGPRSRTGFHHPEWLLRHRDGAPVCFSMAGMTNHVLDPTHPGALEFVEELYRKLRQEYGFPYHKVDFTRAVVYDPEAVFHDPTKNRVQAYAMGIQAMRRGIGEDGYLNICGGLYGPLIGVADAQRSGSDVKSTWPPPPQGEESQGYGPFTIKQNTLRYWWNLLWDNDPDALMVRRRGEPYRYQALALGMMSDTEALTSTLNQYLGGGLVCTTENLTEIEDDRLLLLRHCAPSVGAAAIPRDVFTGPRFPALFDTSVEPRAASLPAWHTISVVNWFDQPRSFSITLDRETVGSLVDAAPVLRVADFGGNWVRQVPVGGRLEVGPVPPHGCEVVKVQPLLTDQPCLVRTDGHFSMGGTEVVGWHADADVLGLQLDWPWPLPLTLELLPPAGRGFAGGEPDQARSVCVTGPVQGEIVELRYG
jgi:hypothetical protein